MTRGDDERHGKRGCHLKETTPVSGMLVLVSGSLSTGLPNILWAEAEGAIDARLSQNHLLLLSRAP